MVNDYTRSDGLYIDPNLPAIVTIRVDSKGRDPNLPAIVSISVGSKGFDSNLLAIDTIRLTASVMTQTCQP